MNVKAVLVVVTALCIIDLSNSGSIENIVPVPEWIVFYHQTKVNIQILEPRGIQIWIKNKAKSLGFGVELVVNPTDKTDVGCDLCRNVSFPTDGKYFIQDDNLFVSIGDTIKYRILEVECHEAKWSPWRTVFVDITLFGETGQHCSHECNDHDDYAAVRFLEKYVEKMLNNCELNEISETLFFPMENANYLVSDSMKFVKSRLYTVEILRPLLDHVRNVFIAPDGVGFSMGSILEKLKVLELGRDRLKLVDFDEYLIAPRASD
ncbi:uncharacterized protein LOC128740751 [Sabethes cyaneus]|uniref:uncharacterized protein LOC128740751 n=1 Tax=Sabethes cyaneus TaxID=53552 RepID=UPI00237EC876|nr:uncharacterized protein LOC128740751 [Sabethes cyaneus]